MAPMLDKIAPMLEGKMAIGKVDCTVHKSLCSEYSVRGYPTLKYAFDGDVFDYPGSRDEDSLIAFAKRMSAPAISKVSSYEDAMEFLALQTEEGVAFLGYDSSSTAEAPSPLYQVFSQVARKKQASAYFLWLDTPEGGGQPFFIKRIESDVKVRMYEEKGELSTERLTKWVQEHNVPQIATLGPSNFQRIGNSGRPLVMSVIDTENEDQVKAIKAHMADYISHTADVKADQYYYGIIDGKKWARFLEQFRVVPEETPQMIILDVPTKKFWQNSTYSNMFEFMKAVEDEVITSDFSSPSGKKGALAKYENLFLSYFPYSLGVLLLLVVGVVICLVPSSEGLRPPFHPPSSAEGDDDEPLEDDGKDEPDESKKDK
jgi:hypothetical protein